MVEMKTFFTSLYIFYKRFIIIAAEQNLYQIQYYKRENSVYLFTCVFIYFI